MSDTTNYEAQKAHAARIRARNDRRIWKHDMGGPHAEGRTAKRQAKMTRQDRLPPDGNWLIVGELRDVDAWLNDHVAIVRRARGGFAVVGHYRQAHVEIGPFMRTVDARRAWNVARPELETFRQARIASRRDGTAWPLPGAGGTGWTSQAGYTARCGGCARRAARRTERSGIGADGGAEAAPGPLPARPVPVRRRDPVAAAPPAG